MVTEENDDVLGSLIVVRDEMNLIQQDSKRSSRALAIALTHLDTAILWRREDLRIKGGEE